ncbi:hypothetical protein E2C01_088679 [Portunus trituberculatus]|uniref:Uncharacterized protein n=1 Tax=Portunus trituberculatus TaxID=210409 RepID=A0A5B7JH58_PORTR|nr:hypothetical protein [Portunus trituberculatus]
MAEVTGHVLRGSYAISLMVMSSARYKALNDPPAASPAAAATTSSASATAAAPPPPPPSARPRLH